VAEYEQKKEIRQKGKPSYLSNGWPTKSDSVWFWKKDYWGVMSWSKNLSAYAQQHV
jgi:hypothetical protein